MNTTNKGVVALGHALMDMMGTASSRFWDHLKINNSPSHVSPEDAEVFLGNLLQHGNMDPPGLVSRPGGSAINVTASCKELGLPAVAVACVGNDRRGQEIRDSLRRKEIPLIGTMTEKPTGVFISVSPPSNQSIPNVPIVVVSPAAARAIRGMENFEDFLTPGWHLHIDGLLLDEMPWLIQIAKMAKANDMQLSIDTSTTYIAKNFGAELVDFAGTYCDYLLVNEQEYNAIGHQDIDALVAEGCALVIKLGSRGARFISSHLTTEASTEPLNLSLDIGAGDSFAAGFLKASIYEASPKDMLRAGNSAASDYLKKLNRLG